MSYPPGRILESLPEVTGLLPLDVAAMDTAACTPGKFTEMMANAGACAEMLSRRWRPVHGRGRAP